MWFGFWTIVEAEYSLDYILQFGGNVDRPGTAAVAAIGMLVLLQLDSRRPRSISDSSSERASRIARCRSLM
jgi:hypothetical protein